MKRFVTASAIIMSGIILCNHALALSDAWDITTIEKNAKLAAEWMSANPKNHHQLDWTYGAFYAGITALGLADPTLPYLDQVRKLGRDHKWGHLPRTYHADDHCIGQSWLELAILDNAPAYAERIKQNYEYILSNPHKGTLDFTKRDNQKRWSWCDALFMSPTVLVKLYGITGDTRYLEFMDQEFKATYNLLYSKEHHLFYRDSRFITERTKNDKPVFWCRGNGWVFGALPIILRDLPGDWPTRDFYTTLYTEMAAAIKNAQHVDGAWRPSLLDLDDPDLQEMSGTSFFTYGFLWGINNRLLPGGQYLPVVKKSWSAITRNINDKGRLGWVQPIGHSPKSYTANDNEVYAVGAFLCASVELRKLLIQDASPQRVIVSAENPINHFRAAETVELNWSSLDLQLDNLRVFDVRNGCVIPHQLISTASDSTPDTLIFSSPFMSRQSREFWIFNSADVPAASDAALCFSRHAPDRLDDFLWENNRTAARLYGPGVSQPPPAGEGLISSGVDIWNKSVPYPIIDKWLKLKKYHVDAGEGMDNYKVGPGRGCGGFAAYNQGTYHVSKNWASQRHLYNGPIRTAFELTYAPWECGAGITVEESRRVSIDVGSQMTRYESRFKITGADSISGGPGMDISVGRDHHGILTCKPNEGWIANWEPELKDAGTIATALVVPGKSSLGQDQIDNLYLLRQIKNNEPVVWYGGAAWSGSGGFIKAEQWNDHVEGFAAALHNPLKIKVIAGKRR